MCNSSEWAEASTLILIAKNNEKINVKNEYNYRLLMAKRSCESSLMPNAYIFPGGKLDEDDFSHKWLQIFGNLNIDIKGNRPLILTDSVTKSQIIKSGSKDQLLSTDLALRIAAIRETYEETGILLSKYNRNEDKNEKRVQNEISSDNLNKLRNSEINFCDLCIEHNIEPDICSLYEWSNWMTPEIEKRRFDTLFYIAFVDSEPETHFHDREISKLNWSTPEDMLNNYYNSNDILLAPPQLYELSRLRHIKDFQELKTFASERQKLGLEQWLAKIIPRDTEKKMDLFNSEFIIRLLNDDNAVDTNIENTKLNRITTRDTTFGRKFFIECNIKLPFGQLSPL